MAGRRSSTAIRVANSRPWASPGRRFTDVATLRSRKQRSGHVVGGKVVLGGLYDKLGVTTETISRGQNSEAAKGRKKSYRELDKLAQGRVYTGRMAEANGLVDQVGTLEDAIAEAKKAAGFKPDEEVELLILPRPKTIFEQLLGGPSVSAGLAAGSPELLDALRRTQLLRRLFSEPTLMWMPYAVKLK